MLPLVSSRGSWSIWNYHPLISRDIQTHFACGSLQNDWFNLTCFFSLSDSYFRSAKWIRDLRKCILSNVVLNDVNVTTAFSTRFRGFILFFWNQFTPLFLGSDAIYLVNLSIRLQRFHLPVYDSLCDLDALLFLVFSDWCSLFLIGCTSWCTHLSVPIVKPCVVK